MISKFYPQIKLNFIFSNSNTIGQLFKFKDRLPPHLASCVVYKYSCGQCPATYIGETLKQFRVRVSQHKGISFRTNNPLQNSDSSKIFQHSINCNHPVSQDNFKILSHCDENDLRTLESIYIYKEKPTLNDHFSSTELSILN